MATQRITMKIIFSASDKVNVIVKKEGSDEELQKFSIGSISSGCILSCSDGSLIRVTNDSNVVEFSPIIKGLAKTKIIPADVLKNKNGLLEIEGELIWFTFMNYPQKLIIPQE